MSKERRLGRGLEALLGDLNQGQSPADEQAGDGASLPQLNVYEIDSNPFQPRREFEPAELDSLCESLKQHGLLQPVTVRRVGERFQLVAGERRLRAAIKAGWSTVPAQVIEADDRQMVELAIIENLQRRDLNALEKAASFQQYLERFECTQEELAARLQLDRSTVANLIRLLELPGDVQDALRRGAISAGHARALLPLGEEHEQQMMCQRIEREGLSVRAVEGLVQEALLATEGGLGVVTAEGESRPAPRTKSQQLASLEQDFKLALGMRVELKQSAAGKGKLTIHFGSHDDFERLRERLMGQYPRQQAG